MNIEAAKAVADAIRTSLGPRGMDKMVGAGVAALTGLVDAKAMFESAGSGSSRRWQLSERSVPQPHAQHDALRSSACATDTAHLLSSRPARREHRTTVAAVPAVAGGPGRRRGDHHQRRRHNPEQDAGGAAGCKDAGRPCQEPGGCLHACLNEGKGSMLVSRWLPKCCLTWQRARLVLLPLLLLLGAWTPALTRLVQRASLGGQAGLPSDRRRLGNI